MSKTHTHRLIEKTLAAVKGGHSGLFTTKDLSLLTDSEPDSNFTKFLYKAVQAGVLEKVCSNRITTSKHPDPTHQQPIQNDLIDL